MSPSAPPRRVVDCNNFCSVIVCLLFFCTESVLAFFLTFSVVLTEVDVAAVREGGQGHVRGSQGQGHHLKNAAPQGKIDVFMKKLRSQYRTRITCVAKWQCGQRLDSGQGR